MSLPTEKKNEIKFYLLNKIAERDSSAVRKTAENFDVTNATVYKYLDELIDGDIIVKLGRGKYEMKKTECIAEFNRSLGQIVSEEKIYGQCVAPFASALPKNVEKIWEYAVNEMINNVIDHSDSENLTVTVESDYLNTTVVLHDDGVGIFEKIKNYFGFDSLDEAITELFKGKLTTDSNNHSGEGIFFSSRMTDKFAIVSSGKVFSHDKFDYDSLISAVGTGHGTAVIMTLSNFSKRNTVEIFDEYADVDEGFTRTKIKVSNYFESSPVSRSQAKRLCNRLDSFREVILDFDGTEWMGQGFAHQLFVVYPNNNPSVKLIPENMNDAVRKMYRHVKPDK